MLLNPISVNRPGYGEHQALVRARVVVGSESFTERFEHVRTLALAVERDQKEVAEAVSGMRVKICLLYTSPSQRDQRGSRMPSSA